MFFLQFGVIVCFLYVKRDYVEKYITVLEAIVSKINLLSPENLIIESVINLLFWMEVKAIQQQYKYINDALPTKRLTIYLMLAANLKVENNCLS